MARATFVHHALLSVILAGCTPVAPAVHPHSDAGVADGGYNLRDRPPMPSPDTTGDAGLVACFPAGFRTTRIRMDQGYIELCGVAPNQGSLCFSVHPLAQHVGALPGHDGPLTAGDLPEIESPIQRSEAFARGARASIRGGTLSVTGPGGQSRTVIPRAVAFTSLEDAVVMPWADGRQFALVGWRAPDLGSMSLIDPVTLRMQGKAAELPCP